jgi:hypothetical protein
MHEKHTIELHVQIVFHPDDEHMTFETWRRHEELIENINLKRVTFVG